MLTTPIYGPYYRPPHSSLAIAVALIPKIFAPLTLCIVFRYLAYSQHHNQPSWERERESGREREKERERERERERGRE